MSNRNGTELSPSEQYRRHGYALVRNVFTPEEIEAMRSEVMSRGDEPFVGLNDFDGVLLSEKIIDHLRPVLGEHIVIFGDSSVHRTEDPSPSKMRHFHVDSRADDFEYANDYPIIRIGIYLQDHDVYSGGLKLRPGSWKNFCREQYGLRRTMKYAMRLGKPGLLFKPTPRSINVPIRAGDLAFWNLRTHHTGYAVRLKFAPDRSFHPRIENLFPRSWHLPVQGVRCSIFATYAAPSAYLDKYLENRWAVPGMADAWRQRGAEDPAIRQKAEQLGLELRVPDAATEAASA